MFGALLSHIDQIYEKHGMKLALGAAFLMPIRLNLCYIVLLPLIAIFLISHRRTIFERIAQNSLALPLFTFSCVGLATALFGLDPVNSIIKIVRMSFFGCALLVFCDIANRGGAIKTILSVCLGQTTSAIHSVIDGMFPHLLPPIFIGKVSESGQLALSLVCALGLTIYYSRPSTLASAVSADEEQSDSVYELLWGFCNFVLLFLLSFSSNFQISRYGFWSLLIVATISIGVSAFHAWRCPRKAFGRALCLRMIILTVFLPLLANALLVNLKRGPWSGVIVALLLLLLLNARKYLLPVLLLIACLFTTIDPLRQRLERSSEHFFIAGGRNAIWQVGSELTRQYPLGIGFGNSAFLQKFDPQIPPELRHFHSNFLNIVVETGWLGLCTFLWWLISIFRAAFKRRQSLGQFVVASTLGCALLSWQVAGVVEYNFGDSEVVIIAFILTGLLSGLSKVALSSTAHAVD